MMLSPIGAAGFEPATSWSQTRRATGLRHTPLRTVFRRQDTKTQDKLLLRAPEEYLDERPECPAAVRDAVLRRRGSLTEGHPQLGRVKQRVVAEPARPSGLRQDNPLTRGFHDLGHAARRREKRHDTTIAGPPALLGDAGELLEQQRVVRGVRPIERPAR